MFSLAGNYIYIETSRPRTQFQKAYLISPKVRGDQCVRFSYHMNGENIGSLQVSKDDLLFESSSFLSELFTKSGNQGNQWKKAEVQVNRAFFNRRYTVSIYNF